MKIVIPAAKPSNPSSQLIAFIMPIITIAENNKLNQEGRKIEFKLSKR